MSALSLWTIHTNEVVAEKSGEGCQDIKIAGW